MGWKEKVGKLRTRFGKGTVDLLSERVEQLIIEGNFSQALHDVEELLENKGNIELADQLRLEVLRSKCIRFSDNYQEALTIATSVIDQGKSDPTLSYIVVDACIQKASAEFLLGQIKTAMESIEMGEMLMDSTLENDTSDNKQRRGNLLYVKGTVIMNNQLELSLEYLSQAHSLYEEINDKTRMADALIVMGEAFTFKGKSESALNCYMKAKPLLQEMGNRMGLAGVEMCLGTYFGRGGEYGQAIDCMNRGLTIFQMYDDKAGIAGAFFRIGRIYLDMGELNSALDYLEKDIPLVQELGDEQFLAWLHFFIGKVYRIKRASDEALKWYEKALVVFRKVGDNFGVAACLANMGILLHTKGELDSSLKNLEESLEMSETLGHMRPLTQSLYRLISVAIDMNNIDLAESYLQRLQKHSSIQEGDDNIANHAYRVAQSLILKTGRNPRKRAKAEDLLEQVVKEDVIDSEITTDALLALCGMLLEDLRLSGDKEILEDLKVFVNQLSEIAQKQHSYWLLAESYWLQSQIALVEVKTKDALQLMSQAQLIAEEHELNELASKISREYDSLLEQEENWERLAELKAPLSERIDAANINDQLERMVKKEGVDVPDLPDEEPIQFLLVAAAGGVNLVTKSFQSEIAMDESLVSGFLSALSSFSEEIFSQSLDRVRIGEFTMLMQYEDPFLFCYVFKGQSYSAIQKMKEFIQILRSEVSLRKALEHTVATGAINQAATASVEDVLTQVFVPVVAI